MRHETKIATVENVVTAICFGVGALLVVLALYTLMEVKPVHARHFSQIFSVSEPPGGSRTASLQTVGRGASLVVPQSGQPSATTFGRTNTLSG